MDALSKHTQHTIKYFATVFFSHMLKQYVNQSAEMQSSMRQMADIVCSQDSTDDEKTHAIHTLMDALLD